MIEDLAFVRDKVGYFAGAAPKLDDIFVGRDLDYLDHAPPGEVDDGGRRGRARHRPAVRQQVHDRGRLVMQLTGRGPSRGRRARYTIRSAAAIHSQSAVTTANATKANVAPFMRPFDRQQTQGLPPHFGHPRS